MYISIFSLFTLFLFFSLEIVYPVYRSLFESSGEVIIIRWVPGGIYLSIYQFFKILRKKSIKNRKKIDKKSGKNHGFLS